MTQPSYLLKSWKTIDQAEEIFSHYREVNKRSKRQPFPGFATMVEHSHWDKTRIRISGKRGRFGNSRTGEIPITQAAVDLNLRALASRDREILDAIDEEISDHQEALKSLAVKRKAAVTRAFNQGLKVPLTRVKKSIVEPKTK